MCSEALNASSHSSERTLRCTSGVVDSSLSSSIGRRFEGADDLVDRMIVRLAYSTRDFENFLFLVVVFIEVESVH